MFFLLRVGFWLSVVLILLPTGKSPPASHANNVGATEAVTAAAAALADFRHFCERQPEACAVGGSAAVTLGHRAQAGAKMIYEFLSEQLGTQETSAPATSRPERTPSAPAAKSSQHTLTPADLAPAWRGPQPPRQYAETKRPS